MAGVRKTTRKGVTVRNFRIGDLDELKQMVSRAWHHTYRGIYPKKYIDEFIDRNYTREIHEKIIHHMARKHAFCRLAMLDGKIVGICNFSHGSSGWELVRLYVEPDLIGTGVGNRLLDDGERAIAKLGAKRYHLYVHRDNQLGLRFYERRGLVRAPESDTEEDLCLRMVFEK